GAKLVKQQYHLDHIVQLEWFFRSQYCESAELRGSPVLPRRANGASGVRRLYGRMGLFFAMARYRRQWFRGCLAGRYGSGRLLQWIDEIHFVFGMDRMVSVLRNQGQLPSNFPRRSLIRRSLERQHDVWLCLLSRLFVQCDRGVPPYGAEWNDPERKQR